MLFVIEKADSQLCLPMETARDVWWVMFQNSDSQFLDI